MKTEYEDTLSLISEENFKKEVKKSVLDKDLKEESLVVMILDVEKLEIKVVSSGLKVAIANEFAKYLASVTRLFFDALNKVIDKGKEKTTWN